MDRSQMIQFSKENILPLRQGRKPDQLETALQAETNWELQKQLVEKRAKFESDIRFYDGNDPLQLYYEYVIWLEQSYPKHGRDANLIPVLERALTRFKSHENYKKDVRFVQIFIKYVETQPNPEELCQLAYGQGIGKECAIFYKAWAEFFQAYDAKRADKVFQMGLENKATPINVLQDAHIQFQLALARRMLEGNDDLKQVELHRRPAFSSLGSKTPAVNGSTGKNKKLVLQSSSASIPLKNARILAYNEEQDSENLFGCRENTAEMKMKIMKSTVIHKENTMKPGKWSGQTHQQIGFKPVIPTSLPFIAHEDPDENRDYPKHQLERALKSREELELPRVIFSPPSNKCQIQNTENVLQPTKFENIDEPKDNKMPPSFSVYSDEVTFSEMEANVAKKVSAAAEALKLVESNCKKIPVALFSPEDPKKKCVYPKKFIYEEVAGKEIQFEQVYAARYWEKIKKMKTSKEDTFPDSLESTHSDKSCTVNTQMARNVIQSMWNSPTNGYNERDTMWQNPQSKKSIFVPYADEFANSRRETIIPNRRQTILSRPKMSMFYPYEEAAEDSSDVFVSSPSEQETNFSTSEKKDNIATMIFMAKKALDEAERRGKKIPVAIFSPADAKKKSVYPKNLVYPGGERELQLEEVKAQLYWKRFEEMEKQKKVEEKMRVERENLINFDVVDGMTESFKHQINFNGADFEDHSQVTVHTQAALDVIRNMWNSPLPSCNKRESGFQKPMTSFPTPPEVIKPIYVHEDTKQEVKSFVSYASKMEAFVPYNESMTCKPKGKALIVPYVDETMASKPKVEAVDGTAFKPKEKMVVPHVDEPMVSNKAKVDENAFGDENRENDAPVAEWDENPKGRSPFVPFVQPWEEAVNFAPGDMDPMMQLHVDDAMAMPRNLLTTPFIFPRMPEVDSDEELASPLPEHPAPKISRPLLLPHVPDAFPNSPLEAEDKENKPPFLYEESPKRKVGGILTPAIDVYVDPELEEVQNAPDLEEVTCNTQAFTRDLLSSTPLRATRVHSVENDMTTRRSMVPNLSAIMEMSRERYSSSSGSSGTSGTSTCKTFANVTERRYGRIREVEEEAELREESELGDEIDPFDARILEKLLRKANFPKSYHATGLKTLTCDIPLFKQSTNNAKIDTERWTIMQEIGRGSYAKILKGHPYCRSYDVNVLKIQKPACKWEWYISKEIQQRLKGMPEAQKFFANFRKAFIYTNGSVMILEWAPYGSLLNMMNAIKGSNAAGKGCPISVCTYLSMQLISAIDYLHSCNIIHGDVKPDNFVLYSVPNDLKPCIQLIDFGRSIDMTLFKPDTTFNVVVTTDDFTCGEMKEKKPWTYQTDLYGLAGTIFILLMGEYMKTQKKDGVWITTKIIPRYLRREVWQPIFHTLLNVPSCSEMPNLADLKASLTDFYATLDKFSIHNHFTTVSSLFKSSK